MANLTATVMISRAKGRETVDSEVRARDLDELYAACRDAPPSKVTRIAIKGPDGEVRLNFASFIKQGSRG
jgi:hypothetical protein